MCGICGIADSQNRIEPAEIRRLVDSLEHRGPDDEGVLLVGNNGAELSQTFEDPGFAPIYALGHRRLSILDIEGGAQPMSNEDDSVWITYNGELYNCQELREELSTAGHLFKTNHSDTEVILHAYEEWGVEGFNRFNGIFSFGLLDLRKKRLLLARDHFGVKPLYYFFNGNRFIFASEIKTILACDDIDRELDLFALNDYLSFRYVPSPRTAFQNIFKLEAGGFLELDLEKFSILNISNYTIRKITIDYQKSLNQWVSEYQELFEHAVKRQLISDVEIGALLSGGVDSSAVCAVATKALGRPIRTYTVGFKDFPEGNEIDDASKFAKDIGAIHKNVIIDNCDFVNVLDKVAWFMDEPIATSSAIPLYYLTKEIKKDVKVVLTGQGADEPLAGYPRYLGERLYQMGFKYLAGLQPLINSLPRQERLKRAFRCFRQHDTFNRFMDIYCLFDDAQKNVLLKEPLPPAVNPLLKKLFEQYEAKDGLGRMLYIDTRAWLPDDLLLYSDKATMVNGLEARVPILDKDLVGLIESMPSKYKLSLKLTGKLVHKKACEYWLPSYVMKRRKMGFATPIDKWFRNQLGGYVKSQLLDGRVCRGLFNAHVAENMILKHQEGKENYNRQLFALLMLEKWAQAFDVKI